MGSRFALIFSLVLLFTSDNNAEISLSFTLSDLEADNSLSTSSGSTCKSLLSTLCIDAVESGDISAVKKLIQNQSLSEQLIYGVDFEDGETALMKAARKNYFEVQAYALLLQFMCTLTYEYNQVVHILLREGADSDVKENSGKTALMIAASLGHDAVVSELLKHPSYLSDLTALVTRSAETKESSDAFTPSIDHRDVHGRTALLWACYAGQFHASQLLLDHGASIDLGDNDMRTPLMWAATSSRGLPIAQLLLSRSADPQRRDANGATALIWAQERGDERMIALISGKWQEVPRDAIRLF